MQNLFWKTIQIQKNQIEQLKEIFSAQLSCYCYQESQNKLFIFPYNEFQIDVENPPLLWIYDLNIMEWTKQNTKGLVFKLNKQSSCIEVDNKIFIYGGLKDSVNYSSDIFILDLKKFKWQRLFQIQQPHPRINPIFFHREREIYLIGGHQNKNIFWLNKGHSFEIGFLIRQFRF